MTDKIILTGIKVTGRHGCSEEERSKDQTFILDLELYLDLTTATKSDDLGETIDYATVIDDVKKIVGGTSRNLIETVAQEIAVFLLRRYMLLDSVKVTLHKPAFSAKEKFSDTAVELVRSRTYESLAGIWKHPQQ